MRQFVFWLQTILIVNASEKPNIVFVFVDDLGWADVGFHNPKIQVTPFLDSMAKSDHAMELGKVYSTHRLLLRDSDITNLNRAPNFRVVPRTG